MFGCGPSVVNGSGDCLCKPGEAEYERLQLAVEEAQVGGMPAVAFRDYINDMRRERSEFWPFDVIPGLSIEAEEEWNQNFRELEVWKQQHARFYQMRSCFEARSDSTRMYQRYRCEESRLVFNAKVGECRCYAPGPLVHPSPMLRVVDLIMSDQLNLGIQSGDLIEFDQPLTANFGSKCRRAVGGLGSEFFHFPIGETEVMVDAVLVNR